MRENGGRTPSPGHPAAAPLTAILSLSAAKGADARAIADGGQNMKMAESMVPHREIGRTSPARRGAWGGLIKPHWVL